MLNEDTLETAYQSGKRALLAFRLDAAFEALTEPALQGYNESMYLLSLIVRSATRIRKVKEERFERFRQEADTGNAFAQYVTAQYWGVRKQDWDSCFRYSELSIITLFIF